jgi:uncharacterized protein
MQKVTDLFVSTRLYEIFGAIQAERILELGFEWERATVCMSPSGTEFHLLDANPELFQIEDFAHHLSHNCRFTGGTRVHYSVAQHSWLVAQIGPHWKREKLLHDASEAVLGDVASPLKMVLRPIYKPLEDYWSRAIYKWFGCEDTPEVHADVKAADRALYQWERRDLMPEAPWLNREPVDGRATLEPWSPFVARTKFLELFHELGAREVCAA